MLRFGDHSGCRGFAVGSCPSLSPSLRASIRTPVLLFVITCVGLKPDGDPVSVRVASGWFTKLLGSSPVGFIGA